jgi:glycosyltransferase involved in cell wall biosynthesis
MESEVSIIVPVYNASAYLRDCLDSVIRQTWKNWTCFLVNDGSTDNSQTIIDEYCILDSRFVGLWKRNEGSVAKPRYYAMRFVKSDFVIMLDADDILGDDDYVERLMKRQSETNSDMVISHMCCFENETSSFIWTLPDNQFDCDQVLDGKSACLLTIPIWKIGLNGNLSRKNLYSSLSKADWANWDEVHARELLLNSNRVAFSNTKYYYRKNPSSITRTISPYLFDRTINDAQLVKLAQRYFSDDKSLIKELVRMHFAKLRSYIVAYEKIKEKFSKEERNRVEKMLAQSYDSIEVGILYSVKPKWGLVVALLRYFSCFQRAVILTNNNR